MTSNERATRIRAIIISHIPPRGGEIAVTDDSRILEDLGFDSMSLLEATVEIEDLIDEELSEAAIAAISTVGDLIAHIDGLLEPAEVAA